MSTQSTSAEERTPKMIGTIFATAAQLAKADAFADKQRRASDSKAASSLAHCDRKTVGGEVRFYETPLRYAVAGRSGLRWFEVRGGQDFACK
jgi:hypothetical protein